MIQSPASSLINGPEMLVLFLGVVNVWVIPLNPQLAGSNNAAGSLLSSEHVDPIVLAGFFLDLHGG